MSRTTHHTIEKTWDAPFDAIRIAYAFTPGFPSTGPSLTDPGEPGEPDNVDPLLCRAKIDGEWEDQSERVRDALTRLLRDDMVLEAREEIAECRSYARAAAREAA